jgi:dihydroorotase
MILKNCTIIRQGEEMVTDILIENGKIAKIGKLEGKDAIDVEKRHVLPGLIDPHVHFREPGLTHKEDFLTGSMAAAAGGITTFLDMPNTVPPTTTIELLEEKRKLARKSVVNYGFHFGASVDGNIDEIRKAKNIASTKLFMNVTTGKMLITDDKLLKEVFASSKIVSVHAEGEMVNKAIRLAKETGTRLYLCHISAADELEAIREMKTPKIYSEATPHHLFLSSQDGLDAFTKMKPELKSLPDQEALFDATATGLISTIGTDHAPHTIGEKMSPGFPFGVPGCETMLPLLLNAVNDERLTLQRVIELCCENPAVIFGIKDKGFIREGYDADLVIVDMDFVQEVSADRLFTKSKWSPFEGMNLKGWPVMTIVNGNIVFEDGQVSQDHAGKEVTFLE